MVLCGLVCMSLFALGVALTVADDKNAQLGHTLGQSILKSMQEMNVLENQGVHVGSASRQSLVESLLGRQEALTNPEVAKAVAAANSLAEHHVLVDSFCMRNWSQPCPDGWAKGPASNGPCSAPDSYQGGCGKYQDFASAGIAEKANFAAICGAPWVCIDGDQCPEGHEYDSCPEGWEDVASGLCRQSSSTEAKCESLLNLVDMNIQQKQEVARDCNLRWKCKESCDMDLSAKCPAGWDDADDLCVAPVTYAGKCEYTVNTDDMNEAEKQAFASHCDVRFPCVGMGIVASGPHSEVKHLGNGPIPSEQVAKGSDVKTDELGPLKERFEVPNGSVDSEDGIYF